MQKEVYLVVVSLLEGRNFPKRMKHQLVVECKFDGELLSTDPIEHTENPDFTTELAWELDKKALHQHRMRRTPIKVHCYAVNKANSVQEQIGYVLLDLRLAREKCQVPKWYNLLSSKYSRLKPAIKVGLVLEDDLPTRDIPFKAREAPPRPGLLPVASKDLIVALDEHEGHLQIGPSDICSDLFVLSVTITYAVNLEQLIPSNKRLPGSSSSYFFYYNLLGRDVANDAFTDLLSPGFVPERSSVRIRSSVDVLWHFLSVQSTIQIHLCCGDNSLGYTDIALDSLLKKGSKEIELGPVAREGVFVLHPPDVARQQIQGNIEPKVGVTLCLKKKEISCNSAQAQIVEDSIEVPDHLVTGHLVSNDDTPQNIVEQEAGFGGQSCREEEKTEKGTQEDIPECSMKQSLEPQITSTPSPLGLKPVVFKANDHTSSSNSTDSESSQERIKLISSMKASANEPNTISEGTNFTETATHPVVPSQARHYRFSLHLKSIIDLDLPFTPNAFLKYSYPFFGSAAPVVTTPSAQIQKKIETTLPHSFCTFDFACTASLLQNTFYSVPLVIELWHSDKDKGNMLLATTVISLRVLMNQDPMHFVLPMDSLAKSKEGIRLSYSTKLQMLSIQKPDNNIVADLNVSVVLEDFGIVRELKLAIPIQPARKAPLVTIPRRFDMKSHSRENHDPRKTVEYQAAVEIELWKEQQEQDFKNQLKEMEVAHMRSIAEEWQKRDKERESLMGKRITEYNGLEKELRKSLAEVETREKRLSNNELELARIRGDMQREHERIMAQAKEATNRMKEDCVHQVQLERERICALEEERANLKSLLVDTERKYYALDQKFQNLNMEKNGAPELRLQSELQLMTLEKNELERKLESVNKSKLQYKQQWGRALKELALLKQREQDHAMANLKHQQQELEQMRMRYLSNRGENSKQQEINQELEGLKSKTLGELKSDCSTIAVGAPSALQDQHRPDVNKCGARDNMEERVARLLEERDTLLRTGVYSREDRIIVELDRQISDAISSRQTTAT